MSRRMVEGADNGWRVPRHFRRLRELGFHRVRDFAFMMAVQTLFISNYELWNKRVREASKVCYDVKHPYLALDNSLPGFDRPFSTSRKFVKIGDAIESGFHTKL